MNVLGVDPGTRLIGWGLFISGKYNSCGLVRSKAATLHERAVEMVNLLPLEHADLLVLEIPQVYRARKSKGNPNDLIKLTYVSGQVANAFSNQSPTGEVRALLPFEWKSNLPKRVVENQMRDSFSVAELRQLNLHLKSIPDSLQHNAIDGIALAYSACKKTRYNPA